MALIFAPAMERVSVIIDHNFVWVYRIGPLYALAVLANPNSRKQISILQGRKCGSLSYESPHVHCHCGAVVPNHIKNVVFGSSRDACDLMERGRLHVAHGIFLGIWSISHSTQFRSEEHTSELQSPYV